MLRFSMLFHSVSANVRVAGWSESWYFDGDVLAAETPAQRLCEARAAILPSNSKIIGQRYQVIGGMSRTSSLIFPGTTRLGNDVPQMALLCRVVAIGTANKKLFTLRGLPDNYVVAGELAAVDQLVPAVRNYLTNVSILGFRFRGRTLTNPQVNILSVAADGTFQLTADLIYNQGDYLTMMRVKDVFGRSVKGSFYVLTKTDARNGRFASWPAGVAVGQNGRVRKLEYQYPQIAGVGSQYLRVVVRKVGRPFDLYHGRAPARR